MTTLAGYMFGQFSFLQYLEFLIRILISCICGTCIGYERTKRMKVAGIRTHVIVCCAAALTMIISKYGFVDMVSEEGVLFPGTRGVDPARLAAQIISGVSFIGAGIIFRNGNSVRGLTTAAGIWATACIGLAIGSGMYVIGMIGTIIIAIFQIIMHRFTVGTDSKIVGQIQCKVKDQEAFKTALDAFTKANKMHILSTKITFGEDGISTYDISLFMNADTTFNELVDFLSDIEGVNAISCELGR